MTKKVLVIIPDLNPTAEIIIQSLKKLAPEITIKVGFSDTPPIADICSGAYQIILLRLCDPALQPLLTLMITAQIPYLYYLDDNLWEIKGNTPLARYHSHPKILSTLTAFVTQAYSVIAGSAFLKDYIYTHNPRVKHISAGFDFDLLTGLEKKPLTHKINILYAGSLYRDQDFKPVIPAINRIAEEFKQQVMFHFHGFVPEALKTLDNITFDEHFYDYATYLKMQYTQGYDIGLAPLHDCPSSRAKSELKYREYGACGIAGIYSNIPPYTTCVTHQKNGLLIENTSEDWYQALKQLITNETLRKQIIDTAHTDVRIKYNHNLIALDWLAAINQLPSHHHNITRTKIFLMRLQQYAIRILCKLNRINDYYQYHGLLFTCKKIARNVVYHD